MKKFIIIIFCFFVALLSSIIKDNNVFLTDSKNLINILLTLLGLCFTSYSIIISSIKDILNKDNNSSDDNVKLLLNKLLDSIEKNIIFIFYITIIMIVLNTFYYVNFPFLKDPKKVDFGIFMINSFKDTFFNIIISLIFNLSLYSLYDLIKASFKLLRCSFN